MIFNSDLRTKSEMATFLRVTETFGDCCFGKHFDVGPSLEQLRTFQLIWWLGGLSYDRAYVRVRR